MSSGLSSFILPLRPLPSLDTLQHSVDQLQTQLPTVQHLDAWDRDYILHFCTRLLSKLEMNAFDESDEPKVNHLTASTSDLVLKLNNNSLGAFFLLEGCCAS